MNTSIMEVARAQGWYSFVSYPFKRAIDPNVMMSIEPHTQKKKKEKEKIQYANSVPPR